MIRADFIVNKDVFGVFEGQSGVFDSVGIIDHFREFGNGEFFDGRGIFPGKFTVTRS